MAFNPIAFRPMAVSLISAIVYLGLFIPLIILHETIPKAPSNPVLYNGLNTTEAWLDLTTLTNGYHHYNTHRNDEVRNWLLRRIEQIMRENEVSWKLEGSSSTFASPSFSSHISNEVLGEGSLKFTDSQAVLFDDLHSNVTCSALGPIGSGGQPRKPGQSTYFEGTNIIVYIRGTEDEAGDWWNDDVHTSKTHGLGGVLVNAHYDSVSTGYGATDDGVGVVTVLQLIKFFTTPGNTPKKGIVALLNNGEEDFLNGARAFTQHPISTFPHTFLNLEGAGAGGRAVLFRSTDAEVTRAYGTSRNPFGTVVGADGFKLGVIRSGTDYSIFQDTLGLRGLDVAFWYPRARYHTDQDDAKHTNVDSLWHMLSASVSTMSALTSDTSDTFLGPRPDGAKGKAKNGSPSDGVWFDLFGKALAVFTLRGLFAWSLAFLIASPLVLILVSYLLIRQDKFYFFAVLSKEEDDEHIHFYGWRGFSRFPITLIVSASLTIGSAFLVAKVNPLIVYSSHYNVWAMMFSLNFTVFWFIMRGADFVRPSALTRGYAYLWMFILGWSLLVAVTVLEDRHGIAAGYIFVFLESALFLAALISLLELFALPTRAFYAESAREEQDREQAVDELPDAGATIAPEPEETADTADADENSPLIDRPRAASNTTTTFANYARRSLGGRGLNGDSPRKHRKHYGNEQAWSANLPTWTWLIQFLLVAPVTIITTGQVALFIVEGIVQTGADGSSLLLPPLLMAIFTIILLLPITPVLHRFTHHLASFLFLVFIGTLTYTSVAFPFSANNRYKAYFQQTVNLETGQNQVSLAGLEDFIRPIISTIPSAAGQNITCDDGAQIRSGVRFCSWSGISPEVVSTLPDGVPPEKGYTKWLSYNVTRNEGENKARFEIQGQNTKACVLRFDHPIRNFSVVGAGTDDRFEDVPETGSDQIKLWHRNWDESWTVDVEWAVSDGKLPGDEGMAGKVVCLWSDDNTEGVIPALDEIRRYMPDWAAVTKLSDGLVEGWKPFII